MFANVPSRASLVTFGALASFWLLITDRLSSVSAGPVSASGLLTLITACCALAIVPMVAFARKPNQVGMRRGRLGGQIPWPLTLFGFFVFVRLLMNPSMDGIQNVAVYVGAIAIAAVVSLNAQLTRTKNTIACMRWTSVIASAIFLVSYALGMDISRERGFAVATLIFLAILIPYKGTNKVLRLSPYLVTLSAFLSLSRTAAVIGAVLLVFTALRGKRRQTRKVIVLALTTAVTAGSYWAFNYFEPFRERFFGGDVGLNIGGVSINTSGRATLWEITWASAAERPWVGHGPGAAQEMISALYDNISHPHNDYLRLLNDFGWTTALLFIVGAFMLSARILKRARRTDDPVHWSAFIGLLAVAGVALTDNVIVYPFVMFPLAVLVGMSLGQPVSPKSGEFPAEAVFESKPEH